jgi:hypothetical protein
MLFIDTAALDVAERLPGWHGRYFHTSNMTFAHYGQAQVARPGTVALVPADARYSVKALTDGRAIIVDSPRRPGF